MTLYSSLFAKLPEENHLQKIEYRKLAPNGENEIGNECHRSNSSLTEDENEKFQLVESTSVQK